MDQSKHILELNRRLPLVTFIICGVSFAAASLVLLVFG